MNVQNVVQEEVGHKNLNFNILCTIVQIFYTFIIIIFRTPKMTEANAELEEIEEKRKSVSK